MKENQLIAEMTSYLDAVVNVLRLESERLTHVAKLYDLSHQLNDRQKVAEAIEKIKESSDNLLVHASNIDEFLDNPPNYTIN